MEAKVLLVSGGCDGDEGVRSDMQFLVLSNVPTDAPTASPTDSPTSDSASPSAAPSSSPTQFPTARDEYDSFFEATYEILGFTREQIQIIGDDVRAAADAFALFIEGGYDSDGILQFQ